MWNPFKKTIRVSFVEQGATTPFAKSDVPPQQLPETFAIETEMSLGKDSWLVTKAEPVTKAEFSKSRKLTLWMTKVTPVISVDPRKLLYTMATVCNANPAIEEVPPADGALDLHEDDWRQHEWIAPASLDLAETERAQVLKRFEDRVSGQYFRSCYVRNEPVQPLRGLALSLDDVVAEVRSFGIDCEVGDLGIGGRRIPGGISIALSPTCWMYGLVDDGNVLVLAVHELNAENASTLPSQLRIGARLMHWYSGTWLT